MSLKWYQRTDAGDIEEMIHRVQVMHGPNPGSDGLVTNAEEGSVGRSQIRVDDTDGTFSIRGHRRVMAIEQAALEDAFDGLVWFGFSFTQTIEEGSPFDGIGRTWTIDLDDLNTVFDRRIMTLDAKRPAETDVERIGWLLTTSQANLIDDDTLVSTDGPVNMDACDYRGQKLRDIFDDCAQQSGKNWYLVHLGTDAGSDVLFSPWYGHGTLDTYDSGVTITNDPALIAADETGMTFAPSGRTKLRRDPSRVFSGVWLDYDGGDVFETRPATATAFAIAGRDTNSSAMNVKTEGRARARARRVLGSIKTQEDVIETAIVVPAEKVNAVVHGHQVDVKFSWMQPDYHVVTTGRVLNRTVRQIGESTYELALEIAVEAAADDDAGVSGILWMSKGPSGGLVYWNFPGDTPDAGFTVAPTVGLITPIEDGAAPNADWPYTGWLIGGDGTVDVTFVASTVGVLVDNIPYTVTWSILLNGAVVASESRVVAGFLQFYRDGATVTAEGIEVAAGDVIEAHLTCTPPTMPFFRTPGGTGRSGERLEITGGSLT